MAAAGLKCLSCLGKGLYPCGGRSDARAGFVLIVSETPPFGTSVRSSVRQIYKKLAVSGRQNRVPVCGCLTDIGTDTRVALRLSEWHNPVQPVAEEKPCLKKQKQTSKKKN